MIDSCKGTLVAAAGPVWNPMYNSQFFVSVSAGDIWLLCLYLLFMVAVLTHVFLGRGEKRFEIKMFRNYFMLFECVVFSPSPSHMTPHTIPPKVRWPTLRDWGTPVTLVNLSASRTGLVRIRDVENEFWVWWLLLKAAFSFLRTCGSFLGPNASAVCLGEQWYGLMFYLRT